MQDQLFELLSVILLLFSATTEHTKGEGGYAYNCYINGKEEHGLLAQPFSQAMSGTK